MPQDQREKVDPNYAYYHEREIGRNYERFKEGDI